MSIAVYSPEQVADILGLHVRTVRGYVRDGRLPAVRVGKQYRITERDLRAFTGVASDAPAAVAPHAHVSTVVHIHDVDRRTMDRITTHLTAAAIGDSERRQPLDVHSTYDPSACRLTVFVVGDPETTAAVIGLIGTLTRQDET
ncbi:helix-turn-helix domain-containing protein [Mycolicibacterium sp. S2-37]|uniref:helix-turn-helix domain-containing protein n=1 Tax=Mycolicibacterium sp. S2-37 TaxID=2810297 RepID=UPI001A944FC7|nr:helix-turn-helix domain-containing protein [Mycolicibacterium sp. S2-37]MBO0677673.1 helix-turn-helix domain-containing protein [Mycolicibacterium sp. S2-37]